MDEFGNRAQFRVIRDTLLEKILHRLDVVIGEIAVRGSSCMESGQRSKPLVYTKAPVGALLRSLERLVFED